MSAADVDHIRAILGAAQEPREIVGLGKSNFERNRISQRAAERLLEIIGEAASRLSEGFSARYPDLPLRQAKDTRNFIAHQYDDVASRIIWDTIATDIPDLAVQVYAAAVDMDLFKGQGDSRLTPEGRSALLALVENDEFGEYLDDVCSDESDPGQ